MTALQQFAAYHRKQFVFPVIGITGSNGKTIVKEWLNFLLAPDFNIIRSPKSYNSQVGVPLSVLGINRQHNFGIFEAGISMPNEMDKLELIIKPEIGILNNIGTAHDEGFASTEEKVTEKMMLFKDSKVVIYQKNDLVNRVLAVAGKAFTWSFSDSGADVLIQKKIQQETTLLHISADQRNFEIEIPFRDSASIENAASCMMTMLYLNYSDEVIRIRMRELFPVEMRLKVKNGINNSTLIDDSYSSDFESLKIALDFLESQKQHQGKTVILSDIYQSGLSKSELYERVAKLIKSNKINRFIGIGEEISACADRFANALFYKDTAQFLSALETLMIGNETILIKGARQFKFEQIVSLLEEKTHETVLEINLDAISQNLNFYKAKLKPETRLMVMVKAFGYGNGGFEIAKLLEHHKTDYLGVAFADEGIALKNAGIKLPIMVLNPENSSFASIIHHGLEPEIYSLKGLLAFVKITSDKKINGYPIHIKFDTGMHRLGFEQNDMDALLSVLKESTSVKVKSILSHMATSDNLMHHDFALAQIAVFEILSSKLMSELKISPIRHILNTSGISNYPQAQYDMVRLGIGLYGISNDFNEQKYLKHVGTLKSVISQLRMVKKGESVGYGRRFIASREIMVATIPIGYADGISRAWGDKGGFITINNRKAKIIGSICMDMLMCDCTGIDCKEGDNVIVFGESPTVTDMAEKLHTIPYEILTSISQRVKRVFYRE